MKRISLSEVVVTAMRGTPPDIPLAPGVSLEALTQGDPDPMFVTLQIGGVGESSRNLAPGGKPRWYSKSVEEVAVQTINRDKPNGIRGHLSAEQRGHANPPSVWRAVGAKLDEQGNTWAKLYVYPHAEDVRAEIRTAKATNAPIGLSRYAMGYVNEETGAVEPDGYELEGLDYVHPSRVGLLSASQVPHVTSETVLEAAPGDVSRGDFVSWNSNGGRAMGRIERIERDGTIDVPDSEFTISGTPDDPAALIRLFDGSEPTDKQVGHKLSTLTKVQPPRGEGMDDEAIEGSTYKDNKETHMGETKPMSEAQESIRITELQAQHEQELENRDATIAELNAIKGRYERLMAQLDVSESNGNPVLALQQLQTKLQMYEAENRELLDATIEQQVNEAVKLETMRPMVAEMVREGKPTTKAEVESTLHAVMEKPVVKNTLKTLMAQEAGPVQKPAQTTPSMQSETAEANDAIDLLTFWSFD